MGKIGKHHTRAGLTWLDGASPDRVINLETRQDFSLSTSQWWALVGLMQRSAEDTRVPNPSTPLGLWLEGFEMGLRASDAQLARDLQSQSFLQEKKEGETKVGSGTAAPLENHLSALEVPQSESNQDKTTLNSSSVTAGGESAGELPTPSRIKIVAQRVGGVDGDAGEMTFVCDNFRVVRS